MRPGPIEWPIWGLKLDSLVRKLFEKKTESMHGILNLNRENPRIAISPQHRKPANQPHLMKAKKASKHHLAGLCRWNQSESAFVGICGRIRDILEAQIIDVLGKIATFANCLRGLAHALRTYYEPLGKAILGARRDNSFDFEKPGTRHYRNISYNIGNSRIFFGILFGIFFGGFL
jgi:hypothetical protein